MKIWLLDDRDENHLMWIRSFPQEVREVVAFHSYFSWEDAKKELEEDNSPDILFLDYCLGTIYGSAVIKLFDNNPQIRRPYIVAYSSMDMANKALLKLGANLSIEKVKGESFTTEIRERFLSLEMVRELLEK